MPVPVSPLDLSALSIGIVNVSAARLSELRAMGCLGVEVNPADACDRDVTPRTEKPFKARHRQSILLFIPLDSDARIPVQRIFTTTAAVVLNFDLSRLKNS